LSLLEWTEEKQIENQFLLLPFSLPKSDGGIVNATYEIGFAGLPRKFPNSEKTITIEKPAIKRASDSNMIDSFQVKAESVTGTHCQCSGASNIS